MYTFPEKFVQRCVKRICAQPFATSSSRCTSYSVRKQRRHRLRMVVPTPLPLSRSRRQLGGHRTVLPTNLPCCTSLVMHFPRRYLVSHRRHTDRTLTTNRVFRLPRNFLPRSLSRSCIVHHSSRSSFRKNSLAHGVAGGM